MGSNVDGKTGSVAAPRPEVHHSCDDRALDRMPTTCLPASARLDDALFRQILDGLDDGVYVTDAERCIVYWNRAAERITGYAAREVVGSHCSDNILIHVDADGTQLCTGPCPLAGALADGKFREHDVFLHHRDGHRVPVHVQVQPLVDPHGGRVGAVEIFRDSSGRLADLQRLEELQALAYIDPLTGIGNRRFAEQTLAARLEELRRYGWSFAVLFIDIDHFKDVNDAHGHDSGDAVLRMIARTLAGSLRSFDFLGRWGGEEFLAIVPMQLDNQLAPLAGRCRALAERSSLSVGPRHVQVTVSIGATMAFSSDTVASVIARADDLMYQSKTAGRNRVTLSPSRPAGTPT
jgi:diguanylate cyclase (GGDEF)-like protein/PAS domain S-box-containing protein